MRQLLIAALTLLILSVTAKSQTFRSRANTVFIKNTLDSASGLIPQHCDILVLLDMNKKQLKLYNPDQTFDIISLLKQEPTRYDSTMLNKYLLLDKDGVKCRGELLISNKGLESFSIIYSNISYNYMPLPVN